jgi:hypothetical protein
MRFALPLYALGFGCLLLAGCTWSRRAEPTPQPPDFIKVTRAAAVAGTPHGGNWSETLARSFAGSARLALPGAAAQLGNRATSGTTMTSPTTTANTSATVEMRLQGLAVRAAARRAALRELAAQIIRTTDSQGRALGAQLTAQPQLLAGFNAIIDSQAQVDVRPGATDVQATAQLNGQTLAQGLKLDSLTPQPSADELEQLRQRSRETALELAKAALRTTLLETPLEDGRTFGATFAAQPEVLNEIDALIFLLQPDETKYLRNGAAEVSIYFDRNAVRDVARRHSGGGFHWPHLLGKNNTQ